MIALHFSIYADYRAGVLIGMGVAVAIIVGMDYLIPIWGTKKFGGSKAGVWGSIIGLAVGLFFGPLGFVLGPFLGAFLGEYIIDPNDFKRALKSATGSLIGFLIGTGLKLAYCGLCGWYIFSALVG